MANEENLKPFKKGALSSDKARRLGAKGGRKRAENFRMRKTFRELFEDMLDKEVNKAELIDKVKGLFPDIEDKAITNKLTLFVGLFEKALAGDVRAFTEIRDTIGERPIDKKELTGSNGASLSLPNITVIPPKLDE